MPSAPKSSARLDYRDSEGRNAGVTTTLFAGTEVFREDDLPDGKALQKLLGTSLVEARLNSMNAVGTATTARYTTRRTVPMAGCLASAAQFGESLSSALKRMMGDPDGM